MQQLHGPETAGRLALRSFPTASLSDTIATVRSRLALGGHEVVDLVLVTDAAGHHQGVVELKQIVQARDDDMIASMMRTDWPTVLPETDQEHAVEAASSADVGVLPVVARDGKPLGVLPPRVLLDVLAREHREDVHRIVGIFGEQKGATQALEGPPLRRAAGRLPWLLVGLAMSTVAVGVMAQFEEVLKADVKIAFFIPALVYLADAVGTQTEAIAVRGLSLRKVSLFRVLAMEVVTGALIGMALALIAALGLWIAFGNMSLAIGVGVSLFCAATVACAVGLILPWSLSRMDVDPAFGSGPVATIIQDVLTILIYFTVIIALLPTIANQ